MAITPPLAAKRPEHAYGYVDLSLPHPRAMRAYVLFSLLLASTLSLDAIADQTTPDSPGLTQFEIAGKQLSLSNEKGRCVLNRAGDPPVKMDMRWPCRFSENKQLNVRIEDHRQSLVFMVERSVPMPAPSTDCLTDLQAVRLFKGQLEIAPSIRVGGCGPGLWDQKLFIWYFSK
ncbi:hypothetical protein [Pseudomonas syringae group genomosp. 3]|uniref:Uncharacterized protein n=1 Tax=Pseudomonas syringae pv. primulae TaxID=251707 RepID=A0A3M3Y9L6_9PSED|nr:hypothetical protein [Pseudomonas syringae group genomosp. 3]RMO78263.1 hypothetical protein ALQ36_101890 [Pseudomonas syringae pv. primulae]RMU31900.1 hypothetical protein ALP30_102066 [Pseudomonas syringae pv. primulae]